MSEWSSNNVTLLPQELVELILLKLPPNSLTHFKAVCKRWKFLIESPYFVACYHKLPQETGNNELVSVISHKPIHIEDCMKQVVSSFWTKQIYTMNTDELDGSSRSIDIKDYNVSSKVHSLFKDFSKTIYIGCSNGLFCFTNQKCFILYNPSTQEYQTVCFSPFGFHLTDVTGWLTLLGFGYDCCTYDYKVVRIFWLFKNTTASTCTASVYSFKKNSWKNLEDFPYHRLINRDARLRDPSYGIFSNKRLHWLMNGSQILCFDLSSDKFSLLPQHCGKDMYWYQKRAFLDVIDGCLSTWFRQDDSINIWVMKEYGFEESWTKLLTIETKALTIKLITLSKDKCRLLLAESVDFPGHYKRLSWYDIDTSQKLLDMEMHNYSEEKVYTVGASLQSKLTLTFDKPKEAGLDGAREKETSSLSPYNLLFLFYCLVRKRTKFMNFF